MDKVSAITLVLVAALAATGCTRSSNALSGVSTQSPPQALPSVPAGSVQSTQLDPIDPQNDPNGQLGANQQSPTAPGTQTASLQPEPVNKEPLKHEPLAGAWNVNSDSASCRAILSFTQWSGGYRATTLRCNNPELSSVTAWDIKGSRVVLVDGNGNQVASLSSTGQERYGGRTSSGKPVTFSR